MPQISTERAAPVSVPALTGARGISSLWVVAFHLLPDISRAFGIVRDPYVIRDGFLGVDVFFILSGFILCHVYYRAFQVWTVREHLHFLLIRLARIYPLHAFALLLLGVISVALPGFVQRFPPEAFSRGGFILSLLLLQNWTRLAVIWNGPAWSLSAEWAAYMVFPAVLMSCRLIRRKRHAVLAASLLLSALALLFIVPGRTLNAPGIKAGFLRLACEFTAGCLLAHSWRRGLPGGRLWEATDAIALLALATVLAFKTTVPLAVLPFGYLILSLAVHTGWLGRILSTRPAIFLGEVSYSLYLMHSVVIWVAEWTLLRCPNPAGVFGQRLTVILIPPAIFLTAIVTWKFVEVPFRSLGRHLAWKLAPQPVAIPAVASSRNRFPRLSGHRTGHFLRAGGPASG